MDSDIADLLWQRAIGVLFCSKEQYLHMLERFTVHAIRQDGLLIGAVLICGNEIHLAWLHGRQGTRRLLRQYLGGLIDTYGCAVTKVPKGYVTSQRFVSRLGFERTHEDAFDIHYKIERMHHVPT